MIGAGEDAGFIYQVYGFGLIRELELHQEAGFQPIKVLRGIPIAVRSRVWRRLLAAAGAPAGQVSTRHVEACDALLTAWRGQGPVHAPGALLVRRSDGRVSIAPSALVE